MELSILATILISPFFVQGKTEIERLVFPNINFTHLGVYANALGKAHYNAWSCNYRDEPGYKCISCNAALHCYPGNFALLVQCAGLFPNCYRGYCSLWKTDGCSEDYMFAEGTHGPLRVTTVSPNESTTSLQESTSRRTTEMMADSTGPTVEIELAGTTVEKIVISTETIEIKDQKSNTDRVL